jgi:hypothetical protein
MCNNRLWTLYILLWKGMNGWAKVLVFVKYFSYFTFLSLPFFCCLPSIICHHTLHNSYIYWWWLCLNLTNSSLNLQLKYIKRGEDGDPTTFYAELHLDWLTAKRQNTRCRGGKERLVQLMCVVCPFLFNCCNFFSRHLTHLITCRTYQITHIAWVGVYMFDCHTITQYCTPILFSFPFLSLGSSFSIFFSCNQS